MRALADRAIDTAQVRGARHVEVRVVESRKESIDMRNGAQ